ncbi:MAG: bifunctional diaminohydroxyphosphoribosylaminopyrimidine deaminase/5-amino-6-(5-phosphoribosylamino)uracil reductase RibD [Proteobacteria bacterium]|nr:bifunctional diaminohydroxyphosphoribosylaminopyrimidine deaminase/5-amino-6-(5-phosphoribosylamino)uracil reductase RibD [Pseudomonadota bacterium]
MNDTEWMLEAMREAAKCGWSAHPNPMVGAIIVRDGVELGRGYHHGSGTPHAEVEALRNAHQRGMDVRNADLYVTLEPCNHYGKTPPCTEAIIAAGIRKCYIGTVDSDERVRGSGIQRLKDAGIECVVGFCEKELRALNEAFFTRTQFERPFVTAKWAMTADGRTATRTGSSQWITGKIAREDVHRERARHDGIIAGTQTVLIDNPQLNVRLDGSYRQPTRIILDRTLRIPLSHHVFKTDEQKTILFTSRKDADTSAYEARNVAVELVDGDDKGLDLDAVMRCLAKKYMMTTLYCEGGAALHGSLLDHGVIDQIHLYMAPKIIGGEAARGCIAGLGIEKMADALEFCFSDIQTLGNDIRITMKKRQL